MLYLFLGCLTSQQHANCIWGMDLLKELCRLPQRDRKIKLATSSSHSSLTQGQPALALALCKVPSRGPLVYQFFNHWYGSTREAKEQPPICCSCGLQSQQSDTGPTSPSRGPLVYQFFNHWYDSTREAREQPSICCSCGLQSQWSDTGPTSPIMPGA